MPSAHAWSVPVTSRSCSTVSIVSIVDMCCCSFPGCGGGGASHRPRGWSVAGALSAVDVEELSGNEGCLLEVEHAVHHLVDGAHATDRVQRGVRGVRLDGVQRRLDDARGDCVE